MGSLFESSPLTSRSAASFLLLNAHKKVCIAAAGWASPAFVHVARERNRCWNAGLGSALAKGDGALSARQDNLTADVASLVHGVEDFKNDVRGAIQNLIVANEVTRDLAEQVARLAIQTSQRVADLEGQ